MKTIHSLFFLFAASAAIVSCGRTERVQEQTADAVIHSPQGNSSEQKKTSGNTYRVFAKVTAVSETDSTITIDHPKIEGFMDAMEMPYQVSDYSLLKKVHAGSKGHFTLQVTESKVLITGIHIHDN